MAWVQGFSFPWLCGNHKLLRLEVAIGRIWEMIRAEQ
jgi:hypothetical protein